MRDKQKQAQFTREWAQRNQEKRAAHVLLNAALKKGTVEKQPCEVCGDSKRIHAHHDDYSKPLEVRWLCPLHHKRAHGQTGTYRNKRLRYENEPYDWTKKATLRKQALELRATGLSYAKIGKALGMSESHAYKVINNPPYR